MELLADLIVWGMLCAASFRLGVTWQQYVTKNEQKRNKK